MSTPKVRVVFRVEDDGEVIALFPDEIADVAGKYITCYARIGQHCSAHPSLVDDLPAATPEQYAPLLKEIKRIYEDPEPAYGGYVEVVVSEDPICDPEEEEEE